jgi:predicted DsbA family dithiol-disulfide isomerase
MSRSLRIEVWFDFICPWCLIGKRQLGRALALLRESDPDVVPEVRWRGVQLLPQAPGEGWPFMDFYIRRLGSEAAVRERQAMVLDAARAAGAELDFTAIRVMPNTANAHRLFAAAEALGTPAQLDALLERLFAAHFSRGADLGASEVLLAEAAACGLPLGSLVSALEQDGRAFAPASMPDPGGGVPSFVFEGNYYISGAQPPGRLHAAMRQALEALPA